MRITVDGHPVADLVPVGGVRRTFVPIEEVLRLLARAPLDRKFSRDIERTAGTMSLSSRTRRSYGYHAGT
jgi:antitoxin (DNA-binding transcriptional repressor) of toxin-antitoxin stability system